LTNLKWKNNSCYADTLLMSFIDIPEFSYYIDKMFNHPDKIQNQAIMNYFYISTNPIIDEFNKYENLLGESTYESEQLSLNVKYMRNAMMETPIDISKL
jgi:hypothetical protein